MIRVPKRLVDVLHRFDGRPTEDALRDIDEQDALSVSVGAVQKLVDFGILEADETPAP